MFSTGFFVEDFDLSCKRSFLMKQLLAKNLAVIHPLCWASFVVGILFLWRFEGCKLVPELTAHVSYWSSTVPVVQSLCCVWLFVTAAHQASLSVTIPWNLLKLMYVDSAMPSNHLILSFWPQSFSASESSSVSQFFASGGQSIGASASTSVLPMNIQDWVPLGLTGLISLQSKGLSRVFSNTTVPKHQFFGTQPSLWFNSHIHTWLLEKP